MTAAADVDVRRRVLLLLATTRDAQLTGDVLARSDIAACVCTDVAALARQIRVGAGAVMLTEETLGVDGAQAVLADVLQAQPGWSDLPMLIVTQGGADSPTISDALATLSNVTLLERPLRVAAMVSTVRSALRARDRQYQIQAQLEKLARAHDAEVLAARRKDEFLAMLAHELRNPLAPISNALHVLAVDDSDPGRRALLRAMMSRQVTHMVRLVDDLLEASRLSRGMITLHPERIDLREALGGAMDLARPRLEQGCYALELELPDTPLHVHADPVRIAQVFGNLLNNAAKYGRPGGRIRVAARREQTHAVVEVSDDGTGIDADTLPRVFDLFAQGPCVPGSVREGLGIGLALVRNLVELHGGTVTAHSDGPGHGARFVVRLPATAAQEASAPAGAHATQAGTGSAELRVLVVDDNPDAARSLAMVLESMGLEPRVAHGGAQALRIAGHQRPQLVLLDIGMPEMDGYDVARSFRADPALGDPVLVAVTGWSLAQDLERSHAAGFDHHFTKPADIARLTALVEELRREGAPRPASAP